MHMCMRMCTCVRPGHLCERGDAGGWQREQRDARQAALRTTSQAADAVLTLSLASAEVVPAPDPGTEGRSREDSRGGGARASDGRSTREAEQTTARKA